MKSMRQKRMVKQMSSSWKRKRGICHCKVEMYGKAKKNSKVNGGSENFDR